MTTLCGGPGDRTPPSACSTTMLAGAFSSGSLPSAHLFAVNGSIGAVVAHDSLPPGSTDVGNCGLPVLAPGIVLDGWPTPIHTLP